MGTAITNMYPLSDKGAKQRESHIKEKAVYKEKTVYKEKKHERGGMPASYVLVQMAAYRLFLGSMSSFGVGFLGIPPRYCVWSLFYVFKF